MFVSSPVVKTKLEAISSENNLLFPSIWTSSLIYVHIERLREGDDLVSIAHMFTIT